MDVDHEMRAALHRVNGNTYKRVLEARGRIYRPTPTEQTEIDEGLRDSPLVEAMKKIRTAFESFGDALIKAFK